MKYVAIATYTNGSTTGFTVEAENLREAWQKLMLVIPKGKLQAVNMAEVPSPNQEIK